MQIFNKIMAIAFIFLLVGFANAKSNPSTDVLSFMITNENIIRGEIKIKQRAGLDSPYLIIGCNAQSDDFYILVGNLNRDEFNTSRYSVISNFKDKSYKDDFVPVIRDDKFFLSKNKNNQLFVYQFLKNNQVILDFGKNIVLYFNAKNNSKFVDNMNIIVTHCGIKF